MGLPNLSDLENQANQYDPDGLVEKMAEPMAELWKKSRQFQPGTSTKTEDGEDIYASREDNRPGSEADFNDCVMVVTAMVSAAASALGTPAGPAGSIIGAGIGAAGGAAVARLVCRRVISE